MFTAAYVWTEKIYVNDLEDQCGQKTLYALTNVNDRKRIRVDGALKAISSCQDMTCQYLYFQLPSSLVFWRDP